uniref:Uncharacterized protein n=1 Tax=Meloidogyne javanica TaxID=6303 RepID=A0A915MAQ5_MELJA
MNFFEDDEIIGPFFLGTISTYYGDSGAGVWSSNGLAGVNLGFTAFPLECNYTKAFEEAAHFTMHNYFVGISRIYSAIEYVNGIESMHTNKATYFFMDGDGRARSI